MKTARVKYFKENQEIVDIDKLEKLRQESSTESSTEDKEGFADTAINLEKTRKEVLNFPLVSLQCETLIEDIPTEFASALLRSSIAETPHYALEIGYKDVFKTDNDINISMLTSIINNIPIVYDLSDNEINNIRMSLDITNETSEFIMVKCGDIVFTGNTKPGYAIFSPTIQLTQLAPQRRIKINNIKIVRGISTDVAKFTIGVNGRIWPTEIPKDFSSKTGYLDKYKINFKVNVVNPSSENVCKKIIKIGAEGLIERLEILKEIIIEENKLRVVKHDMQITVKLDETNSIAKMLERACNLLYPEIGMMYALLTYSTELIEIKLIGTDSKSVLIKIIEHCIKFYIDIITQIDKL